MSFQPGGTAGTPTAYNYIGTLGIIKPDYEYYLIQQHKNLLPDLMIQTNAMKMVEANNPTYFHFEQNYTMPKLQATSLGGSGTAVVTLSLSVTSPSQQVSNTTQNPPFPATSPTSSVFGIPCQEGDIVWLPASGGTPTGFNNTIQARVVGVNASAGAAGEVYVTSINSSVAIPAYSTPVEIPVPTHAVTELGGFRKANIPAQIQYVNQIQQFEENPVVTDMAGAADLWFSVGGENKWASVQYMINEIDFKTKVYNAIIFGKRPQNVPLATQSQQDPITYTNGMFAEVNAYGLPYNYPSLTGFDETAISGVTLYLDGERSNPTNKWLFGTGISLNMNISQNLTNYFDNGALVFGQFDRNSEQWVNFQFSGFEWGGHWFEMNKTDMFNYAQSTGAQGFNFRNEGFVVPFGHTSYTVGNEGQVPMMRIRHRGNGIFQSNVVDLKTTPQAQMGTQLNMFAAAGFEIFGANGTVYVSQS